MVKELKFLLKENKPLRDNLRPKDFNQAIKEAGKYLKDQLLKEIKENQKGTGS